MQESIVELLKKVSTLETKEQILKKDNALIQKETWRLAEKCAKLDQSNALLEKETRRLEEKCAKLDQLVGKGKDNGNAASIEEIHFGHEKKINTKFKIHA